MARRHGWKQDRPDPRDFHRLGAPAGADPIVLSPMKDIGPIMPPVYDQGRVNDCTANGVGAAFEYLLKKQGLADFMPSRLFLYYNTRDIEGDTDKDEGASIRDVMKALNRFGFCPETMWPHDVAQVTAKPSAECYAQAQKHLGLAYHRVSQDIDGIKSCINDGIPVIFGMKVFESFESDTVANTGVVPMPICNEKEDGGHCMLITGWDDISQQCIVRNSYSENWGQKGYCRVPYAYTFNKTLAWDFWCLTLVE